MKWLLIEILPRQNGWKQHVDSLSVMTNRASFALYDPIACKSCSDRNMHCGNEEVARFAVTGGKEVVSIPIEEYLRTYARHYKKAQGCKCDYLHYDSDKQHIVLNELTCSQELYVAPYHNDKGRHEGKRIHAMKQMGHVIDLLMDVPELASFIQDFTAKHCLFSWRIPERNVNAAEKAMNAFMAPQRNVANVTMLKAMNNDFFFVQQIYPCEYSFASLHNM